MSKPMGVAAYRLTQALPERLKSELPTSEELAAELPLLDFLTLRIQLEKKLAQMAKANGLEWEREGLTMYIPSCGWRNNNSPATRRILEMLQTRVSLLSVVIGFSRAQPQAIRCSAFFLLQNPKS
jgi:hypothetical protein